MTFLQSIRNSLILIATTLILCSCTSKNIFSSVANAVITPSTEFFLNASNDVNPDLRGRASPVVVTILELVSRSKFDQLNFFDLYDNTSASLGPDLLQKYTIVMHPNSNTVEKLKLKAQTHFVAIFVAYQKVKKARWRGVIEVYPTGYSDIKVHIEKLAMYIED